MPPFAPYAPYRRRRRGAFGSTVPPAPAAPSTPDTPSPADTATSLRSLLSWASAGGAKFDIYLDTVSPPTTIVVPKFVGTSYVPQLQRGTTYYWKIVAFNDGGSAAGPVWSFTTPKATDIVCTLAGVPLRGRYDSLSIHETYGPSANTGVMTLGVEPQCGQSVQIGLGSLDAADLIFGGEILDRDQTYVGTPTSNIHPVSLIDRTFRLNKRHPFGIWVNTSVSVIARYIAATYAPDFTTNGVADDLPAISINFDGSASFTDCWNNLGKAINGRARVDYARDLKLYVTSTDALGDSIDALHPPLNEPPLKFSIDHSQIRTRGRGKGHGERVSIDVAAGEYMLPIADAVMFNPAGGMAIIATTSDGAQGLIITYAGVQLGGGGSLVGPGAAPNTAPSPTLAVGTGLGAGVYRYAYTDVTAAGESLPSPLATITTGPLVPPGSAPSASILAGAGLGSGVYQYAFTDVTATGETLPSPLGSVTTTTTAPPSSAPGDNGEGGFGSLVSTGAYSWATTWVTASGETLPSPLLSKVMHGNTKQDLLFVSPVPPDAVSINLYRTVAGGSQLKLVTNLSASTVIYLDELADGSLGANAPTVATAGFRQVYLYNIAAGPAGVTARKVYRTVVDGSQLKLLTTLGDNATLALTDSTADGALGANAPTVGTAAAQSVNLTGVALGPSGTIARRIYRTTVNGSQFKLYLQWNNNTDTGTFSDTIPDGSLGANAPTSDTSGLSQPSGQVNAGSTALPVASPAPLSPVGGWATLQGGQTIRYTGIGGAFGPAAPLTVTKGTGGGPPYPAAGTYQLAYAWQSAAGVSLLSPPVSVMMNGTSDFFIINGFLAGPTGTTGRVMYIWAPGDTGLKQFFIWADNTSLGPWNVYTWTPGVDAPTSDTSGLGGTYLLGIPAAGPGSIQTTVLYGSQVVPAPALTGINQWNGVPLAVAKGASANIFVQRDDLAAQAILGQLELDDNGQPTDGIREGPLFVDERMGEDLLIASVDAELATFSRPIVSTAYLDNRKTHAGLEVPISLATVNGPWGMVGNFTVQSVDVGFVNGQPRWSVQASSVNFTLSDLRRRTALLAA